MLVIMFTKLRGYQYHLGHSWYTVLTISAITFNTRPLDDIGGIHRIIYSPNAICDMLYFDTFYQL